MIPLIKALHISTLVIWCGGLIALPLMLSRHDPAITQADYANIRRYTHFTFVLVVTPAAVLAIGSGTVLIFMREVFQPWLFAKLSAVCLLVLSHAWLGHVVIRVAETAGRHVPPHPRPVIALQLALMLTILVLVLAKPDPGGIDMPGWLSEPRGAHLPLDVPMR